MGSVIIELGEKTSFIHFYRSQLLLVLTIVLAHFSESITSKSVACSNTYVHRWRFVVLVACFKTSLRSVFSESFSFLPIKF